jgi:hypothetical protein
MEKQPKKYHLTFKRLIASILIVAFTLAAIAPAYAGSRSGNFGDSSSFSQTVSGAYTGAQASSTQSWLGWDGLLVSMGKSIVIEAVNLWYYVNYYNDYGKSLISFEVGGTTVDISRGQMVRMVASVAVNAMVGLASGGYNNVSSWAQEVANDMVNQFVYLLIQEAIRDILVRKFGMDPNFAGIISGILSQMLTSLLKIEEKMGLIWEAADSLSSEYDESETIDAGYGKTVAPDGSVRGYRHGDKLNKSRNQAAKNNADKISNLANFLAKKQATDGLQKGKDQGGIYSDKEAKAGLGMAMQLRARYVAQLHQLRGSKFITPSARKAKEAELLGRIQSVNQVISGLSRQLASPNNGPVLSTQQLSAARNQAAQASSAGLRGRGQDNREGPLLRAINGMIVKPFIGAVGLVSPKAAAEARAALKEENDKPAATTAAGQGVKAGSGAETKPGAILTKTSGNSGWDPNSKVIYIGDSKSRSALRTADGKALGDAITDGRIFVDDNGREWVATVVPGKGPMLGPVLRSIDLENKVSLTLPDKAPIRNIEVGQQFNGSDGNVYRVKEKVGEGSYNFEPITPVGMPKAAPADKPAAQPAAPAGNMKEKPLDRSPTKSQAIPDLNRNMIESWKSIDQEADVLKRPETKEQVANDILVAPVDRETKAIQAGTVNDISNINMIDSSNNPLIPYDLLDRSMNDQWQSMQPDLASSSQRVAEPIAVTIDQAAPVLVDKDTERIRTETINDISKMNMINYENNPAIPTNLLNSSVSESFKSMDKEIEDTVQYRPSSQVPLAQVSPNQGNDKIEDLPNQTLRY